MHNQALMSQKLSYWFNQIHAWKNSHSHMMMWQFSSQVPFPAALFLQLIHKCCKFEQSSSELFVSPLVLLAIIIPTESISVTNHNYIKVLESDWSSAAPIWAVIGQLYLSCLSNWTVRVIKHTLVALEWVIFFSI